MKIYRIAQYKPWEMTRQEFMDYHNTGYIPSSAYQKYSTIEGLSWIKKSNYPILYSTKNFGGHIIEFRKSGEKLKYTAHDPNDDLEILRDESGRALMMSDEEVKAKGYPLEDLTIAAFDGDTAIGWTSDEFGTDGVWVVKDYQRLGIGTYLLAEMRKQNKDERKVGQMTEAGYNMTKSYHKNEVKMALERGDLTPDSPKYEEIIKDYPELRVANAKVIKMRKTSGKVLKILKMYRIAQSSISIDISRYAQSAQERIDLYTTYDMENHQRISEFSFDPNVVINSLRSINYPNIEEVRQLIQSKNTNGLHDVLMNIFEWWKSNKEDHTLWSKVSPAVKALNDYDSILSGNKITWTEEFGQQKLQELVSGTQANMEKIQQAISDAISRIPSWNGSPIKIIASEIYKENDLEPETDAYIEVGQEESWGGVANFTYFAMEDEVRIDDVLEGGDEDFFSNNNTQSDYFNLINSLRNPNAFSKPLALTLYTARPMKDRDLYNNAKEIPSNIFLTNKYDFAEGFSREYGGNRDVWKVRVLDRYLVKTMDSLDQKQYQTTGTGSIPVISMELITPWQDR